MNESDTDALLNKGKAYHEAGHAVLHLIFGMRLEDVSIVPTGELVGGTTQFREQHPVVLSGKGVYCEGTIERDRYICHGIMATQAGEVAQTLFCPESVQPHHAGLDRRAVKAQIKAWDRYANASEQEDKLESLYCDTRQLLAQPLCVAGVTALAQELVLHRQLSGERARCIIREAMAEATKRAKEAGGPPLDLKCPHCEEYAGYEGP